MFHWRTPDTHGGLRVAHGTTAATRFRDGLLSQREQADARIFWVLIAQWAVILVSSITIAAQWKNVRLDALSSAVIWVGILSVLPLTMVLRAPGTWQARWSVVTSQGVMSSMLWAAAGGTPETHLHLFAWLVVVALYRDVPALLSIAGIALAGHLIVWGNCELFNLPSREVNLIWFTWLAGEVAFMAIFILLDRQTLASETDRDHAMESMQAELTGRVEAITRILNDERNLLQSELSSLSEQRATSEAVQQDLSRDLTGLRRDVAEQATAVLKLVSRPADASLSRDWRAQWQAIRRQAQHLMHLVDVPSLPVDRHATPLDSHSKLTEADHKAAWKSPAERRSLLMMRNPLQQARAISALEAEGFKVDVAVSGPRTYYSVMLNDYSVIVVDIDLPGDEGFDTLEALRLLPEERVGQSKRLFAITAARTPEHILRCTELQVDGIFEKPLSLESLQKSLNRPRATIDQEDSDICSTSGSRA